LRKISIAAPFLVSSIISFLLVTLLPFSVSYEEEASIEMYLFIYFNGRVKMTQIYMEEETVLRFGAGEIWLNQFALEVWLLILIGLGLVLVASLYKILSMDLEDPRISAFITICGGILGLVGTLLYIDFYNTNIISVYFRNQLLYGFYISIAIFSVFIAFGVILLLLAFFVKPKLKDEIDPIKEALKS
jgi:hypothetical protein